MENKLFNSVTEMKMRICLLLSEMPEEFLSADKITAYDFIALYGKIFGIPAGSLHAQSNYIYGELASKRELVRLSIKELVCEGMAEVDTTEGFRFRISENGYEYAEQFKSNYARRYRKLIDQVTIQFGSEDEFALMRTIQEKAIEAVRG